MTDSPTDLQLESTLLRAQDLGFLGPGPLGRQIEHGRAFAAAAERANRPVPHHVLDLGAGGGVPGLVLAASWSHAVIVLVDANQRRAGFLQEAVENLGLGDRVTIERERAEILGRSASNRGEFDCVVARGFGPPAVTAECGSPFLSVGGILVVSDPPENDRKARWSVTGLADLGLALVQQMDEPFHFSVLVQGNPCPDRYPRRVGVPRKRPLF